MERKGWHKMGQNGDGSSAVGFGQSQDESFARGIRRLTGRRQVLRSGTGLAMFLTVSVHRRAHVVGYINATSGAITSLNKKSHEDSS